ncbi:dihydrolipoamide acetyltransferase family protein [Agriterribacter sp.]|uniref:dihydrolipoamide acetyltransferase family protein n=1 Tax=Agriterribacter sp. TaxID=2821509 RepID=UPI002B77D8A2|nr:dihydrolipoamide acetyltransferase family protein [Agriterribacter sp.]HRO48404.1 dihydrolipoamide acetyltransferase family protein [Agriterribacter sp.]HRQ19296.1 dihydrolipoamide acetyltransferase family protein [Agriterribacter sp.]
MAIVDLVMPKLGESIMEATILHWSKKPGDHVKVDETVLEIATDKVDSEVPSTAEGIVEELLYRENDVVPVGAVIAKIRSENGVEEQSQIPEAIVSEIQTSPEKEEIKEVPYQPSHIAMPPKTGGARFYSPLVLNIAANEGVSLSDLEKIPGTGNEGRVTKKDILQWIAAKSGGGVTETVAQPQSIPIEEPVGSTVQPVVPEKAEDTPQPEYSGNVEVIEMDRTRRLIAKHMVESQRTSAHVTSFTECDVTSMVLWREKVKAAFEKQEGEKLTFTPLFIEAIIKCIKKYPWLNASVEGDKIIVRKDINISMATALPNGNLIVPVIQEADMLNLTGLAKKVNRLADAARNNRLRPDDTQNGTFTVTNVGTFGSLMGTPIINQPQVAILAIGAIKKRPVVVETKQGDSIAIRHMMYLSLSYDHRIVDGSLGATFLTAVAHEMENFDVNRSF